MRHALKIDHPRHGRRRAHSCGSGQSPVHSAHVGQFVEVHYRWHALFGRHLRIERVDTRRSGQFVHVEVMPGIFTVVAAWMLDASACACMTLGAPRVSIGALSDLDELLIRQGLRRSSSGDITAGKDQADAGSTRQTVPIGAAAVAVRLDTASQDERRRSPTRRDAPCDPAHGSGGGRGNGAAQ